MATSGSVIRTYGGKTWPRQAASYVHMVGRHGHVRQRHTYIRWEDMAMSGSVILHMVERYSHVRQRHTYIWWKDIATSGSVIRTYVGRHGHVRQRHTVGRHGHVRQRHTTYGGKT